MAGDWIKMQGSLWTNPKVVRIMSATKADKCRVIGALYRVWCLFDEHTEDGMLQGYTKFVLDDELRIDGFSEAMESVGWLIDVEGDGLQVPDFNDHMSKSAKKRAQDTKRKREGRKVSASQTDKSKTREEKRREEYIYEFNRFYSVYPKKKNRGQAEKAFKKLNPTTDLVDQMIESVNLAKQTEDWKKENGQFIPYPASWLNAKGWLDEYKAQSSSGVKW
jgi:hypothetical protein